MGIDGVKGVSNAQMQFNNRPQQVEPKANVEMEAAPAETVEISSVAKASENGSSDAAQQAKVDNEMIRKAVEQMKRSMNVNTEAVFGFHEDTNRITIKIVDKSSKEVIKEVPAEKTLDMIARVWEMAGILVDEKR